MPQENVEIVRRAFEHFTTTGEPLWETTDPDFEVFDPIPDAGVYRGREGVLKGLADWSEPWAEFSLEPERWIDAVGLEE